MLAASPRPIARSTFSQVLRAACTVQAIALLVALLALADLDHVLTLGVACVGLGASAGGLVWRLTRA